jgi:8-oxo-dGTP pyrophosphatase MutT (NUDIX family)
LSEERHAGDRELDDLSARAALALRKTYSGIDRDARAAVAVVLCPRGDDADVLFIRRPRRDGDRWSGDVAFPGGMSQPGESAADTAAREAREEVGLALGRPVGALRDRTAARPGNPLRLRWSFRAPGRLRTWLGELARLEPMMRVRPIVYVAPRGPLTLDAREVAEAFFVPLSRLRRLPLVLTLRRMNGASLPFPALDLDGRALWGLSLSMVLELRELAI